MDLSLTPSQILIRDSVRSFVKRHVPRSELVRLSQQGQTWDPGWFADFREAGWTGALVPTSAGGLELDPLSVALIFEELGRGAVPSPLLASSVIATCLLLGCQTSEPRDAALAAIADGSMILIPALRQPETSWKGVAATGTSLTRTGGDWVLTGTKVFVPFADAATHFLVSVTAPDHTSRDQRADDASRDQRADDSSRDQRADDSSRDQRADNPSHDQRAASGDRRADRMSGDQRPAKTWPALAIVPAGPGVATRPLPGFLQANHEVDFESVPIVPSELLRAAEPSFDDALAVARVVTAAYQVGGMLEMLDMSVEHSNTRIQFGTPIGRFQRVQDHIIRLLNAMDAARWATYEAAWAIEAGRNGVARSYLAGSTASDGYIEAANAAHEVHAAIGSDPRYGLTLYTRISRTMYELLGPPAWQRRQMADALDW